MSEKYHVNPDTGRAGKCTAAEGKCRYGASAPHGNTLELARIAYEELQSDLALPRPLVRRLGAPQPSNADEVILTSTEMNLLIRRLKNQMLSEDFKKMEITGSTPATVVFRGATECSFDYREDSTVQTFTRSVCGLLAHEIHGKTGLPLTVITQDPTAKSWTGHVAVKVGEDQYLDINGVQSMEEIMSGFPSINTSTTEIQDDVSLEKFRSSMGLEDGVDIYRHLEGLERAMLDRIARDLIRDFVH